jgi:hypothetical protein
VGTPYTCWAKNEVAIFLIVEDTIMQLGKIGKEK